MLNGNYKHVTASTVNGVSGHTNIANMWHGYHKYRFNATSDIVNKRFVTQQFTCCNIYCVKEAVKDF